MSVTSTTDGLSIGTSENGRQGMRVTLRHILRSEWTKLYSLRSTRWSLLVTVILTVGLGAIAAVANETQHHRVASFDSLSTSLLGVQFAILSIGVLGVLLFTGEYSTGMIRSTMTAVPKRLPVLWSKLSVYAVVALVVSLPAVFAAFFLGQAILSDKNLNVAISDPGVLRAVVGAALYLSIGGVFAMGIGAILRNTAGGIAAYVAIMFVIPPLITLLPSSVSNLISEFMPAKAGGAILDITHKANTLAPWAGLAVFAAWAAAAVVIAALLLRRRDV